MTLRTALPRARTPDPRQAPRLRWGILGTGWIADRFVASLRAHSGQQVVAVGSRTLDSAQRFATRHDIARAYPSYHELVTDPSIDVIYVATPHTHHLEHALLALTAGKHALIEKPMAINAVQARQIAETAREQNLFCMEAHWTSFLPKYDVLRQLLDNKAIGDLVAVIADFGEWFPDDHRIYRPDLAGGPMLDLGTYLVSLVVGVLGGPPDHITAQAVDHPRGVKAQTSMQMTHGNAQAVLHTTIVANTPTAATIAGTHGTIHLDGPFYQPGSFTITSTDGRQSLRYVEPRTAHRGGLHFQAAEVARRISNGEHTSPLRSLDRTIETISVMDTVRSLTGDHLPGDGNRHQPHPAGQAADPSHHRPGSGATATREEMPQ